MNRTEKTEILVSWLTISIAFAILMSRPFFDVLAFTIAFPISLVTVGAGFVLHELAHRSVARRFGAHAEYRAWQTGLIFAIISSFFGFVFAAPGAVYIYGRISRKQNGLISLAGPATNIVVALVFGLLALSNLSGITNVVGEIGFRINMFLALFNMIPFGPLDGAKIFVWSKASWLAVAAVAFVGVFVVPTF